METEIKELNLEEMLKNNEIDKIIEFYNMEYKLSLSIIDKIINLDKIKFIDRSYFKYKMDPEFRKTIDAFDLQAVTNTKVSLGKYFEEIHKGKVKKTYEHDKLEKLNQKLDDLKKGVINKSGEKIKGCYLNDKLIGYISLIEEENDIHITKLYSDVKGEGIGTKLLNSTLTIYQDAHLDVMINNPARHLYEKLGFTYVKDNNGNNLVEDNNFIMEKKSKIKKGKTR